MSTTPSRNGDGQPVAATTATEGRGKTPRPPFFCVDNGAVDLLANVGLAAWAVYSVIKRYSNDRNRRSRVSITTLAKMIGRGRHTVIRAVKELETAGMVKCEDREGSKGRTNRYFLPPLSSSATNATSSTNATGPVAPMRQTSSTHATLSRGHIQEDSSQEKVPATAGDLDGRLAELINGWNSLGASIVRKGNGARVNPPAKAVIDGWKRSTTDRELREALADIPALLTAIRDARFCHAQPWFNLPWIFAKNKNRELNAARLLAGCLDGCNSNGRAKISIGPGQRHPDDARSGVGEF